MQDFYFHAFFQFGIATFAQVEYLNTSSTTFNHS